MEQGERHSRVWPERGANWFELRNGTGFSVFDWSHVLLSPVSSPLPPAPPLFSPLSLLPITIILNMARGRKSANGISPAPTADAPSDSTATPPPRSILPIPPTPSQSRDVVKVNNASPTELKNALDDAIKRVRIVISLAALSPNNVIRTHHYSTFPDPIFSSKSISTLTCASPLAGLVYS